MLFASEKEREFKSRAEATKEGGGTDEKTRGGVGGFKVGEK